MAVSEKEKREIARQGYAITATLTKQRYWTPDGREVFSFPSWREFSSRDKDGNVTNGRRDANFDKGWLPSCPAEADLKVQCPHCDRWHDTEDLVDECGDNQAAFSRKWDKRAKKDHKKDNADDRMDRLEAMMQQLMEVVSGGKILQSGSDALAEDSTEAGETEGGL